MLKILEKVLDEILALFCHRKYIRKGSIFSGSGISILFIYSNRRLRLRYFK